MRTRVLRSLLALLTVTAVLAVPAASLGGTARIKATSSHTWNPAYKQVPKGTRVIWKNPTSTKHTVTAYGAGWSKDVVLKPGTRTSKVFRHKGPFYYRCRIHSSLDGDVCSGMCGHVHVT
jgi:plastocyanin